jgi:BirA family biotin operon repressor/biotin-[acetyl-CoA-carboxylase] ligase
MNLKQEVLTKLESNRGVSISGAKLAKELYVSRNAVWKAIKSLQEDGYSITAVTNKGYCLSDNTDILSAQSISKYLNTNSDNLKIEVYKTISSTNSVLKKEAELGEPEGKVIIAEEQTSGRGRMGREFYSPPDTGIYMSILLRPTITAEESLFITTSAAVAVAKAIETVAGCKASIKWVNDIYCFDKKVCGILTEGAMDIENGKLKYAVLGIGVNVIQPKGDFPGDLKKIATAIFKDGDYTTDGKSRLAAEILNYFWKYYKSLENREFMEEYINRSFLIGEEINIISGNAFRKAVAIGIDKECRLIVREEDETITTISSGEVSIRKVPNI